MEENKWHKYQKIIYGDHKQEKTMTLNIYIYVMLISKTHDAQVISSNWQL